MLLLKRLIALLMPLTLSGACVAWYLSRDPMVYALMVGCDRAGAAFEQGFAMATGGAFLAIFIATSVALISEVFTKKERTEAAVQS